MGEDLYDEPCTFGKYNMNDGAPEREEQAQGMP